MGYGITLRVWGPRACFTRPEMKAERVSYDAITPSAARGILEAIYWKPQIRWVITQITVIKPIRFTNLRRNEVGCKIPASKARSAMKNGCGSLRLVIEAERQQRAATLLRDVEYLIKGKIVLLDKTEPIGKHLDTFNRRARRGQCFHRPYLGCREFEAQFELIEGDPPRSELAGTPEGNRDLGYMLHDIDFTNNMTAKFFRAQMHDSVITVPPFESEEVRS